ncbi:MAG: hypothetical protein LBK71_01300, partial [Verrucomicrobiales bacterium]|nr:hypothetical protein [Verrucomicrobiales bacterium]
MNKAKLRIIVAGQIPPPVGGQNLMIEQILRELQSFPNLTCEHLPFYFTPSFRESRRLKFYKILELFLVIHRLIMLRLQGNIDLILYPVGGSHLVPLLRDVFLLPWMLLLSRKMVLQFHAAGAAKMFQNHYRIFLPVIRFLYKKAAAAVVMTDYNKRDPEFFGIQPVFVLPHQLRDEYQPSYVSRRRETVNILSLGHICP